MVINNLISINNYMPHLIYVTINNSSSLYLWVLYNSDFKQRLIL